MTTVSSKKEKSKKKPIGTHKTFASPKGVRGQKNDRRSSLKEMQSSSTAARMAREPRRAQADAYVPPTAVTTTTIGELIQSIREIPEQHQGRFGITPEGGSGVKIWMAGDASLVRLPGVAIVGSRNVSAEGAARARRLARELAVARVVVVSGLAKGVDTEALNAAVEAEGRAIGVIGTPITRAYPTENKRLQEKLYREHLLISQFAPDKRVYPSNFPERNKLMAAITDATVIIEASDESGSLHQAAECTRLGRWLFIAKSVAENPSLRWPKDFLHYPTTRILNNTFEILGVLRMN
ncbi:MAG TPA: DNA-processing protein DprA [Candidatus Acidoferrales bacterium]|nr:DNA-processing protein DprA [Candidatus Acidoferrales bacterium]